MKVLERAITPGGIRIQLEDWREDNTKEHSDLHDYTIGAYPIAKNTSEYKFITGGKVFRLTIAANNYMGYINDMVLADFQALKNGEKRLEDLYNHFWNGQKDMYLLGMEIDNL